MIPVLNGSAAVDYAFQLSRGKPHSIVGQVMEAAGHTNMLAAPEETIVTRLRHPLIREPETIVGVSSALRDIVGLKRLGLRGPDRPAEERERLQSALDALVIEGPQLLKTFQGIEGNVFEALYSLIDLVISGNDEASLERPLSPDNVRRAVVALVWRLSQEGR